VKKPWKLVYSAFIGSCCAAEGYVGYRTDTSPSVATNIIRSTSRFGRDATPIRVFCLAISVMPCGPGTRIFGFLSFVVPCGRRNSFAIPTSQSLHSIGPRGCRQPRQPTHCPRDVQVQAELALKRRPLFLLLIAACCCSHAMRLAQLISASRTYRVHRCKNTNTIGSLVSIQFNSSITLLPAARLPHRRNMADKAQGKGKGEAPPLPRPSSR
jgi:hypothetical protein